MADNIAAGNIVADRIERLRELSRQVDAQYEHGNRAAGEILLRRALEESEGVTGYRKFFEGEFAAHVERDNQKWCHLLLEARAELPDDSFLLANAGGAAGILGRRDEAISFVDQALSIEPRNVHALCNKGITLSKLDKDEEAIKAFDQALAIDSRNAQPACCKGIVLSKLGKGEQAIELLDEILATDPQNLHALCCKGIVLSELGKNEEAIEVFDQMLAIDPKDTHAFCHKGVALSKLGKNEQAVMLFDQALAIAPKDTHVLCNKGVALSELGKDEEAIEAFDQALAIRPENTHALRSKGAVLYRLGRLEEEIACYKKARQIDPRDRQTLCYWAVTETVLGHEAEALELLRKAYELRPTDTRVQSTLKYVATKIGRRVEDIIGTPANRETLKPDLHSLRGLIARVQEDFAPRIGEFVQQMKVARKRLEAFLGRESQMRQGVSTLLVLRKWNSFTPAVPTDGEQRCVGGGYFLFHGGKGIVIDPGYNFIENFCQAGGRLTDIDSILLTHAHNDHTADFESLMTLLHQYNAELGLKPDAPGYKRVTVYLNTGSLMKFSGLVDLRGCPYFERVCPMTPGNRYTLADGLFLTVLPAYHDELVSKKYAVGLHIAIETSKGRRALLFTSDTGLYPQIQRDGKTVADTTGREIHELYLDPEGRRLIDDIDLLIAHIGSIREEEIRQEPAPDRPEGVFYPNHLGVLGTARVVTSLRPRVAVISEFGEELRTFRPELLRLIEGVVTQFFADQDEPVPRVLPGDLPFIYDIADRSLYCSYTEKMVPAEETRAEHDDDNDTFYYYHEATCTEEIRATKKVAKRFALDRDERRLPYLKLWECFHRSKPTA